MCLCLFVFKLIDLLMSFKLLISLKFTSAMTTEERCQSWPIICALALQRRHSNCFQSNEMNTNRIESKEPN